MADTPYKLTILGQSPSSASSLAASAPSELLRDPAARIARKQDTILDGRRVLVSRHMGGSDEWLVESSATGGGTQGKPTSTDWRNVLVARTEMHPGQVLVARTLAIPSGATEFSEPPIWPLFGVQGDTRMIVDFANVDGDTTQNTVQFALAGALDPDGAEEAGPSAAWAQLRHYVAHVRPDGAANSFVTAKKWSDEVTITVTVADRGGARVIHSTLSEEALEHVQAHNATASSCNGVAPNLQWPNKRPATENPDGATYNDQLSGVHQMMRVAERQTRRIGPRIAHWTSYAESLAEPTDTEPDAWSTSSTTFVRISAGPNTAWDADAVGWDIMGARRNPEHLRLPGAAANPVIIRVWARYTGAGSATGVVRMQTTARSYVDLKVLQSVVGTTWTELDVAGWLEANIAADDTEAILQDFAKTTSGTLELRYWDVSYGDSPVGA